MLLEPFVVAASPLDLLFVVAVWGISAIIIAWTAGALFFDMGRSTWIGSLLALFWVVVAIASLLLWHPIWKPFVSLLLVFFAISIWWLSLKPSQNRTWDPCYSKLSRVTIDEDWLTISNVRRAEYRESKGAPPQFTTRQVRLSQLRGVDVLILNWDGPWICHPMFVFDFGEDGRICISIEVRYRLGQDYSLVRSLYRQQELMYVVSEEQDAILRRTYQDECDLFLYKLHANPLLMRQFFFEYSNSINALADKPRWYHGLATNCTTSIYAQGRGRMEWDWRLLFNGTMDYMMYERGILDQTLPFDELKRQSRVNEIANQTPDQDFGDLLRRDLPGYRNACP